MRSSISGGFRLCSRRRCSVVLKMEFELRLHRGHFNRFPPYLVLASDAPFPRRSSRLKSRAPSEQALVRTLLLGVGCSVSGSLRILAFAGDGLAFFRFCQN